MNLIENLLQTACEEAAELSVMLAKANRFGLDSLNAKSEKPAHECIVAKHNDLLAVFELLRDRGVVFTGVGDPVAIGEAKKHFVEALELSQKAGTLVLTDTDNAPVAGSVIGGTNDADAGLPEGEGEADEGTDPEDLTNTDTEEPEAEAEPETEEPEGDDEPESDEDDDESEEEEQ